MSRFDGRIEMRFHLGFDAINVNPAKFGLFLFFRPGKGTLTLFCGQFVDSGDQFRSDHDSHLFFQLIEKYYQIIDEHASLLPFAAWCGTEYPNILYTLRAKTNTVQWKAKTKAVRMMTFA